MSGSHATTLRRLVLVLLLVAAVAALLGGFSWDPDATNFGW
jgi:hypothetical protein